MPPSQSALALLQLLVQKIQEGRFSPHDPETFLGYKEVHDLLKLPRRGFQWGASLRSQGLADLATWLHAENLPAITGLIVDQKEYTPGTGYFEAYSRKSADQDWWADEIKKSIAYDWSNYVEDSHPTYPELLDFTMAVIEGRLVTLNVNVRSRCEALRLRARQIFRGADGKLSCEVCGWAKPDNRISGDIVELHHMRPLSDNSKEGVGMTLAEAISTLAPLCPSCHRCAHSRVGERKTFTIEELKQLIPRR